MRPSFRGLKAHDGHVRIRCITLDGAFSVLNFVRHMATPFLVHIARTLTYYNCSILFRAQLLQGLFSMERINPQTVDVWGSRLRYGSRGSCELPANPPKKNNVTLCSCIFSIALFNMALFVL